MNTLKFALSAVLAAGLSAAVPSASQGQYPGGYGTGQNSALAESRKQIKEAELEVTRIRNEMKKMKDRVAAKYEGQEEWDTAKANLKTAETAYEAARKKALAKLYASPEYKAAKEKQLKADQATEAERVKGAKANAKVVEKAQQDRLEAGLALRKMETEALGADPKLTESKDKVTEAKKAWEALQDELKEALEQDAEYVAAQQQLEQAQAQVEQMKATLAQQAASEREQRRSQQEAQRATRGSRGGGGGYGGGGYGGGRR
jgi:flagellin-like hook-associated protein FlgL